MRLRLPAGVKCIIELLEAHGYEAYAVGGCVRDSVLARTPDDWDITTSAKPEEVKRIFRKTVDTGIQHGTVTVLVGGGQYEVTTYRIDGVYLDGRHPDHVTFTPSLREDLLRRDFTINAMAYNDRAGLVDPCGGMADLQRKQIRCVGDPDARFNEDALRIMRAVRFSAQLGFTIDPATRDAIASHAEKLRMISAERIRTEMMKLITSPHPEKWMDLYELGITEVILPEFDVCMRTPQNTPYHFYNVGEHTVRAMCAIRPEPVLRLTMLLHDLAKPKLRFTDSTGRDHFKGHARAGAEMSVGIMRRLKYDNKTIETVRKLIYYHDFRPSPDPASVRRAVYLIGPDLFEDYLEVQEADNSAKSRYRQAESAERIAEVRACYQRVMAEHPCLSIRELAIDGCDLLKLGISGKEIGEILEASLLAVLEKPALNDREILLSYARQHHAMQTKKV